MQKNEILKIYGTDYKEMTKLLLSEGNVQALIGDRHTKIAIKPNLLSPTTADWGATTHPEVAAGIIEYLQECGFDNLYMLEGAWVGDRTSESYKACGFKSLTERYGVPFVDTQKDSCTRVNCAGMPIDICDSVLEAEFLINVPVLKGHCQTRMTCALKNMKGVIPNAEKRRFHRMGLHKPIAHLNAAIHQDLIVADNICGDLDFEDGGNPVVRNCIMLARDAVLIDAYGCRLLHADVREAAYIGIAESLGVGSADVDRAIIRVLGENGGFGDTELPVPEKIIALQDAVEEVDSCSACYGYLIPALQMLKEEGLLDGLKEKICIGQGWRGKSGVLGVGNCTKEFDTCIRGCPPTENEIYEKLKEYIRSSPG